MIKRYQPLPDFDRYELAKLVLEAQKETEPAISLKMQVHRRQTCHFS